MTWQVIPIMAFPTFHSWNSSSSYEALDDYTLQMTIDEIYAPALGQISGLITPLPEHVWQDLDWDDPETNPEILNPSVVSGPYKLVEWNRDANAIFEANESYWYKGRPNFDRYIIEIVTDQDIEYQRTAFRRSRYRVSSLRKIWKRPRNSRISMSMSGGPRQPLGHSSASTCGVKVRQRRYQCPSGHQLCHRQGRID